LQKRYSAQSFAYREDNLKKILMLIALVFIITSGCGDRDRNFDGVTITFWHSFISSTIPALNDLIEKFEQEHPGIRINAQYIPSGDALIQKLVTAVRSRTAPDISWLHSDFLEDLVAADAIYKMEEFINGDNGIPEEDMNDIYPSLIQFSSWRGTLYSMPMEATNLALLYNKDMFRKAGLDPEKPPRNWNELYEYSKILTIDKSGDGRIDQTGMFIPIYPAAGPLGAWMVWQWEPFLWQAGGDIIDDAQSRVLYNSPEGVRALEFWQRIFRELNLRSFTSDFDVAFASERLAMTMDGPWNLPRYQDLLKNLDWAFAPLPAGPVREATVVGGEYLAIFKQSKNPDAAWTFIKWLIQPEVQAFWAMKSGYLPIRSAVLDVPEFQEYLKENPNFAVFVHQMDVGYVQKPIDYGGLEITRNIAEAIEKATIGNTDAKKALDEAAVKSNNVLKSAAAARK
jgi:ABC-type glycerol-3-phosphate transport system substrate-binding protein